MMKKGKIKLKIVVASIIAVFAFGLVGVRYVLSSPEQNVFGWAWTETFGWLSFNSTNCDADNNELSDNPLCGPIGQTVKHYGVTITVDPVTSDFKLSGDIWSDNVGWISFNPDYWDGNIDDDPDNWCATFQSILGTASCSQAQATVNVDSDPAIVTGWARVLANDCPDALCPAGGFDGWVHLNPTSGGVTINKTDKQFDGWAWGGNIVTGWISFNCRNPYTGKPAGLCLTSDYKVQTSMNLMRPEAINLRVDSSVDPCDGNTTVPAMTLAWDYVDNSANHTYDDPLVYQETKVVEIYDGPTLIESSRDHCTQGVIDPEGFCLDVSGRSSLYTPMENELQYNKTYTWKVIVRNNQGVKSAWSQSTFNTPVHYYPIPNFSYVPPGNPVAGDTVTFTDNSMVAVPAEAQYNWDFDYGDPAPDDPNFVSEASGKIVNHIYNSPDSDDVYTVMLRVTDGLGTCEVTKDINILPPITKWKEIKPKI